jgi:hypothetical protein
MKYGFKYRLTCVIPSIIVLILLGACAYQNERLIKLEQTYLSTKQDPQIAQNASIPYMKPGRPWIKQPRPKMKRR